MTFQPTVSQGVLRSPFACQWIPFSRSLKGGRPLGLFGIFMRVCGVCVGAFVHLLNVICAEPLVLSGSEYIMCSEIYVPSYLPLCPPAACALGLTCSISSPEFWWLSCAILHSFILSPFPHIIINPFTHSSICFFPHFILLSLLIHFSFLKFLNIHLFCIRFLSHSVISFLFAPATWD